MKIDSQRFPVLFGARDVRVSPLLAPKVSLEDRFIAFHLILAQQTELTFRDYITKPIHDKVAKDHNLSKAFWHHWPELDGQMGVMLLPGHSMITFACVKPDPSEADQIDHIISICQFAGKDIVGSAVMTLGKGETEWRTVDAICGHATHKRPYALGVFCCTYLLFKKYVEIETKVIGGKDNPRRVKCSGEKHLSEYGFPVSIIDSSYYQRISRTDGFTVSGHWRWQPYGPDRSMKKLIYIKDFEKQGYTRRAKKEIN